MARWLIDKAGVQITVQAKSEPAKALIKIALSAMKTERISSTQGIKLSVKYRDEEWHLNDHVSKVRRKLNLPGDLIYHLTDRIIFHIANSAKEVHCLHAAAASRDDNAVVIPANSGAGKSSFTTWLAANGFDYLTDELILVGADRLIEGIARPIQIKANGLDAVRHLISDIDLVQVGKFANALPLDCLSGHTSESAKSKLRLFVFPQYRAGAEFLFTRLSSAEAGMSLMANHVNARNLDGHGFREMMSIIRNTPCYSLEYGGFDKLPADFSSQLNTLLINDA